MRLLVCVTVLTTPPYHPRQAVGGGYVNTGMDEETSRAAAELRRVAGQPPPRLSNDYQQLPSRPPVESRLPMESDSRLPTESRLPGGPDSRLPGESELPESDRLAEPPAGDEAGSTRVSWREDLDSLSDELVRHSRSFSDTTDDDREVSGCLTEHKGTVVSEINVTPF